MTRSVLTVCTGNVMERHNRDEIMRRWPPFPGRPFLLGHFDNGREIPDPYRRGTGMHLRAAEMIVESAGHWADQLARMQP